VFVAGASGSGRTVFLEALAEELRGSQPQPLVLAGSLATGNYVPWERAGEDRRAKKALALLKGAVFLGAPLAPFLGIAKQIILMSDAARQLAASLSGRADRQDPFRLVPRLLRRAAEERPVVCLVDDSDRAEGGWWSDLVTAFAQEIASDLPLLLFLAVEGPEDLGPHEEDEPDSLYVARRLTSRGLGQWWPVRSLEADELARWIGPAAPEVAESLRQVTGGLGGWAHQLWDDWQQRGVVEQGGADGRWHFAPGAREKALAPINDVLGERLERLLGGSDPKTLDLTRQLLSCAALEGQDFTAEAVTRVLGGDRNELVDFLDDVLAVSEERPYGVVGEAGGVSISDRSGHRHLWRYRFSAMLDWLTLRHHGLTDGEKRSYGLALAEALEELYGLERQRVARKLARLFETGGERDRARSYRRMADLGTGRDLLLWRAQRALREPTEGWDRWDRRRAAEVLLEAATALFHSGPFTEGLQFAQGAQDLGLEGRSEARALHLRGHFRSRLGDDPRARADLTAALRLWQAVGDRDGEAGTRHALASIDLVPGDYEAARKGFTRVLELRQELGDRYGESATRHQLASIDLRQGNYQGARREFARVLELKQQLADRDGAAWTRYQLASIDAEQKDYESARTEFARVLELMHEVGNRDGAAWTRYQLASIDAEQKDYESARTELVRVVELMQEIGDRRGDAQARHQLAVIDLEEGNYETAREEFAGVLKLRQELGDRYGEAWTRHQLAMVDLEEGDYETARAELMRVLGLFQELGDSEGEAAARQELAWSDARQGNARSGP